MVWYVRRLDEDDGLGFFHNLGGFTNKINQSMSLSRRVNLVRVPHPSLFLVCWGHHETCQIALQFSNSLHQCDGCPQVIAD